MKNFDLFQSKRVSFVLNTKNRASYLEKALSEIRGLKKPEDELIIVDGASRDNTARVVEKFGDIVDVFISEGDASQAHALNKGILIAQGKYLKQLADDDTIYPEAFEEAIEVMEKNPEVDVLVCGGLKDNDGKKKFFYLPPGTDYGARTSDPFRYKACGTGFIMRRSVFSKAGLFPLGLAADKIFISQCIHHGANVKFCRINLFYHPILSHSVIRTNKFAHEIDARRAIKQYCARSYYYSYRLKTLMYKFGLGWLARRLMYAKKVIGRRGWSGFVKWVFCKILCVRAEAAPPLERLWDGKFS